ncbi:TPA: hypothetical protein U5D43_004109, partial [Yersinia enterocolitica]|nr:hypothetical protein [Yersinia enterocolitica]
INKDYQSSKDGEGKHSVQHSLFYQLTRISREKGALRHDDRLDVLAMGCAQFAEIMSIDSQSHMDYLMEEFLIEHLERNINTTPITAKQAVMGNITINWDDDDYSNLNMLGNDWV